MSAIGACISGYFLGLRISEENDYEEYFADKETENPFHQTSFLMSKLLPLKLETDEASKESSFHSISEDSFDEDELSVNADVSDLRHSEKLGTSQPSSLTVQPETLRIVEVDISSGDSFIGIARKSGVNTDELTNLLYRSGLSQSTFSLRQGQRLTFEFNGEKLVSVSLIGDSITYTKLMKGKNGGFTKQTLKLPSKVYAKVMEFKITNNFSSDGATRGLSQSEIVQVVDAFRYKVDFGTMTPGAVAKVLFEREEVNGKVVSSLLKAAKVFLTSEQGVSAFYYKNEDGAGYYDENGSSLTPSFLRHPIKNPLITSKFNLNRTHPILDVVRPHWGTDYGHMKGTPILAISDAKVKFAGTKGGFGRTVILSHPQAIETLSAHMSKYAEGIKTGVSVKKGQVIGYVGKSGLSTGYHLHFELKKDGKRVNSLSVDLPTVDVVDDKERFGREVDEYISLLGQ